MKIQKAKRNMSFGYVTIQLAFFGIPFLFLYYTSGIIWWGLPIFGLYILNALPVWDTMKNGIPKEIVLPGFMLPPKNSEISVREIFIRWKIMFAHKALACGYAMVLFGALVAYTTGNIPLGSIIATIGLFGIWQALKGIEYFVYIAGILPLRALHIKLPTMLGNFFIKTILIKR